MLLTFLLDLRIQKGIDEINILNATFKHYHEAIRNLNVEPEFS